MSRTEKCFGKPVPISPEYDPIKGRKVSEADYNTYFHFLQKINKNIFLILPL